MLLKSSKTIVIKIGSSLLVNDSKKIRKRWLSSFAQDIKKLISKGHKIIIVSSGAIALGCKKMNYNKKNLKLDKSQAIASIGQIELMNLFSQIFSRYNLNISQMYRAHIGRDKIKFHYVHAADESTRIDPSVSNIVDTFLLTRSYDTNYRKYLDGDLAVQPLPASSDQLFLSYSSGLNNIKSISDEIIYHPVKYKVLFGEKADAELQATFKIVKNPDIVINDNEVKSRVISAINEFFALDNWDFGETFYFTELTAYVMQQLAPSIVTFVIVPVQESQNFGSLFEIKSESDEIFISGATVADVTIIDNVTATRLKASGAITTVATTTNTGIQSSTGTSSTVSSSSSSTYSSSSSSSSSSGSGGSGSGGGGSSGGYGY